MSKQSFNVLLVVALNHLISHASIQMSVESVDCCLNS